MLPQEAAACPPILCQGGRSEPLQERACGTRQVQRATTARKHHGGGRCGALPCQLRHRRAAWSSPARTGRVQYCQFACARALQKITRHTCILIPLAIRPMRDHGRRRGCERAAKRVSKKRTIFRVGAKRQSWMSKKGGGKREKGTKEPLFFKIFVLDCGLMYFFPFISPIHILYHLRENLPSHSQSRRPWLAFLAESCRRGGGVEWATRFEQHGRGPGARIYSHACTSCHIDVPPLQSHNHRKDQAVTLFTPGCKNQLADNLSWQV